MAATAAGAAPAEKVFKGLTAKVHDGHQVRLKSRNITADRGRVEKAGPKRRSLNGEQDGKNPLGYQYVNGRPLNTKYPNA